MSVEEKEVCIKYFAFLKELKGTDQESIKLEEGDTGRSVFYRLFESQAGQINLERLRLAVNETFVGMDTELSHGDEVVFIPPVAGG